MEEIFDQYGESIIFVGLGIMFITLMLGFLHVFSTI